MSQKPAENSKIPRNVISRQTQPSHKAKTRKIPNTESRQLHRSVPRLSRTTGVLTKGACARKIALASPPAPREKPRWLLHSVSLSLSLSRIYISGRANRALAQNGRRVWKKVLPERARALPLKIAATARSEFERESGRRALGFSARLRLPFLSFSRAPDRKFIPRSGTVACFALGRESIDSNAPDVKVLSRSLYVGVLYFSFLRSGPPGPGLFIAFSVSLCPLQFPLFFAKLRKRNSYGGRAARVYGDFSPRLWREADGARGAILKCALCASRPGYTAPWIRRTS